MKLLSELDMSAWLIESSQAELHTSCAGVCTPQKRSRGLP